MMIFIIGGVKGGKSMLAQCAAKNLTVQTGKLYYLATMVPGDSEDDKRIARHIKDRENWGFGTIEEGYCLPEIINKLTKDDVVLLDSVTAYVQNIIFRDGKVNHVPCEEIYAHIRLLAARVKHLIIVSDYIFSDAVRYSDEVEMYKKNLGSVHNAIAEESDIVIECAYSNMKFWKNKNGYDFNNILNYYYNHKSHLEYKDI